MAEKKRLRAAGDLADPGPRYIRAMGGAIYLLEDLDAYLDALAARSAVPTPAVA